MIESEEKRNKDLIELSKLQNIIFLLTYCSKSVQIQTGVVAEVNGPSFSSTNFVPILHGTVFKQQVGLTKKSYVHFVSLFIKSVFIKSLYSSLFSFVGFI